LFISASFPVFSGIQKVGWYLERRRSLLQKKILLCYKYLWLLFLYGTSSSLSALNHDEAFAYYPQHSVSSLYFRTHRFLLSSFTSAVFTHPLWNLSISVDSSHHVLGIICLCTMCCVVDLVIHALASDDVSYAPSNKIKIQILSPFRTWFRSMSDRLWMCRSPAASPIVENGDLPSSAGTRVWAKVDPSMPPDDGMQGNITWEGVFIRAGESGVSWYFWLEYDYITPRLPGTAMVRRKTCYLSGSKFTTKHDLISDQSSF